jgi:hypothetical protein
MRVTGFAALEPTSLRKHGHKLFTAYATQDFLKMIQLVAAIILLGNKTVSADDIFFWRARLGLTTENVDRA